MPLGIQRNPWMKTEDIRFSSIPWLKKISVIQEKPTWNTLEPKKVFVSRLHTNWSTQNVGLIEKRLLFEKRLFFGEIKKMDFLEVPQDSIVTGAHPLISDYSKSKSTGSKIQYAVDYDFDSFCPFSILWKRGHEFRRLSLVVDESGDSPLAGDSTRPSRR